MKDDTTQMLTFLKHNLHLITKYTKNKHRTESQNDNKPSTSQENQENVDENVDEPLTDLEDMST